MSIRQKIVLLVCGMTFLACTFLGMYMFWHLYDVGTDTAMYGLEAETDLTALKFKDSYREMVNDSTIISKTPPITGILRSKETGIDPKDGSGYELWRSRLAEIFSSVMRSRPHYTQMRFIGLENNGRELVRVNRTSTGFEVVDEVNLQEKLQESYMQGVLGLEEGASFFSSITYNREHGMVDENMTPTVRTVLPVYENRRLFGAIVINVDFQKLLEKSFTETNPSHRMMILTYDGDFAEYNPVTKKITLELHEDMMAKDHQDLLKLISKIRDIKKTIFYKGSVLSLVKLDMNSSQMNDVLTVVLSVPKSELLMKMYQTQAKVFIFSVFILLGSLFVAGVVASRLMMPIQKMARNIAMNRSGKPEDINLPIGRLDEIGDLARSFYLLMENLQVNKLKALEVDGLADGIITFNENGIVQSINQSGGNIFGYTSRELIGEEIRNLLPAGCHEDYEQFLKSYKRKKVDPITVVGREIVGVRQDGSEFPLEVSISETRTSKGLIFTAIVRDITERKQIERMKDSFVSTVNHEIRTPLTTIKGSLGLLQKMNDKLDEKSQRLLELSYSNCTRLSKLVDDILDIEKVAAGKMEYFIERLDIVELVRETVAGHSVFGEKYGVAFDLQVGTEDPIYCEVDANRLSQALSNLLSNAAKYSESGDVITVKVFTEKFNRGFGADVKYGERVMISVTDHGPGIPKDFQSKIFQRFAQADSSSTRSKGGTGLGLNITKSIVEAFKGHIDFSTKEGEGTTFFISLPVCAEPVHSISNNKEQYAT